MLGKETKSRYGGGDRGDKLGSPAMARIKVENVAELEREKKFCIFAGSADFFVLPFPSLPPLLLLLLLLLLLETIS